MPCRWRPGLRPLVVGLGPPRRGFSVEGFQSKGKGGVGCTYLLSIYYMEKSETYSMHWQGKGSVGCTYLLSIYNREKSETYALAAQVDSLLA
jgi:hypothetical protein